MSFKMALAQLDLPAGDPGQNYQSVESAAREAAQQGAECLLLPELWASGYDLANCGKYASKLDQGWFQSMQDLARHYSLMVGGTLIEKRGEDYYNTFVLIDQAGQRLGTYRKIHLFGFLNEEDHFKAGDSGELVETEWGRFGLATCYDLRFPELFRSYAVKGAEIILLPAEWPQKRIAHWDILLQARAVENQCFIAAVNKVGNSQGAKLGGRSAVIDPMGAALVRGSDAPGVLVAEVDLDMCEKTRRWMPVLQDRKPKAYR